MKQFLLVVCSACLVLAGRAQNVAINNDGSLPDPKAQLDIKATNKGVLLPRITDLSAITGNVPLGLLVFVTDGDRGFYYNASALPGSPNWKKLTSGDDAYWNYASPSYLYWNGGANVGIGTATPARKFTVRQDGIGITQESADGTAQMGFYINPTVAYLQTHTNTPLSFATNNASTQMLLATNGNVGIGSGFTSPSSRLLIQQNSAAAGLEVNQNGSGNGGYFYSATGTGVYAWTGSTTQAALYAQSNGVSLIASGTVGIGNLTPTQAGLVVDKKVGAVNGLFGSNSTGISLESGWPGVGLNSFFAGTRKAVGAGYGGLIGLNPNNGDLYIQSSSATITAGADMPINLRMLINKDGNVGLQGNTNPQSPLSFANTVGEKINFYEVNANANYGIGVQGAQLQLYTGGSGDAISFGYGSSAAFTERVRMQNGYTVLNNGRLQFKGSYGANAHGIDFTNNAGTSSRGFMGMLDDNTMGFYGYGGTGWGFLWDVNDGSLRIGTAQKAGGYTLNVGGKAIAEEVRVQLRAAWPDYVFKNNYNLIPLSQLETFIKQNNHLPNIPKAEVLEKEGTDLGEMQRKMMEKIEELSLYIIDLNKKIEAQRNEINLLKKKGKQ